VPIVSELVLLELGLVSAEVLCLVLQFAVLDVDQRGLREFEVALGHIAEEDWRLLFDEVYHCVL